jgi:uncharacterized protein (TIGR02145 family)
MNKMKTIFKTILLTAVTIVVLNCNKQEVNTSPIWNYSTFTDSRDGRIYKYIKIGTQDWMAENLDFQTDSGSWVYWGSPSLGIKYGRLYTWDAAIKAVPTGWHLPSDAEWKQLEMTLGMDATESDRLGIRGIDEGNKLKSESGWTDNGNGTDAVGFTALPGGFRSNPGIFLELNVGTFWWSHTEDNNFQAYFRLIATSSPKIGRGLGYKGEGYSVRCVKD